MLGRLEVRAIYLLVVLNGMGWAFHTPVSRGFLQEILDRGELVTGNAWVEMSLQAGAFLSAGFTGIVLKLLGIRAVLGIAVGTYLLASLLLAGIRYTPLRGAATPGSRSSPSSRGACATWARARGCCGWGC